MVKGFNLLKGFKQRPEESEHSGRLQRRTAQYAKDWLGSLLEFCLPRDSQTIGLLIEDQVWFIRESFFYD